VYKYVQECEQLCTMQTKKGFYLVQYQYICLNFPKNARKYWAEWILAIKMLLHSMGFYLLVCADHPSWFGMLSMTWRLLWLLYTLHFSLNQQQSWFWRCCEFQMYLFILPFWCCKCGVCKLFSRICFGQKLFVSLWLLYNLVHNRIVAKILPTATLGFTLASYNIIAVVKNWPVI
jgi:hypothetical protein